MQIVLGTSHSADVAAVVKFFTATVDVSSPSQKLGPLHTEFRRVFQVHHYFGEVGPRELNEQDECDVLIVNTVADVAVGVALDASVGLLGVVAVADFLHPDHVTPTTAAIATQGADRLISGVAAQADSPDFVRENFGAVGFTQHHECERGRCRDEADSSITRIAWKAMLATNDRVPPVPPQGPYEGVNGYVFAAGMLAWFLHAHGSLHRVL
jgi:hypothetical protein